MNKTINEKPDTKAAASKPQSKRYEEAFKMQAVENWLQSGKPGTQMLTRGFQGTASGHHSMAGECLFPRDGRVLHYERNSAVLDHLAERIATRERTGCKWTQESERFLAYWQRHGRIVFADCGLDS